MKCIPNIFCLAILVFISSCAASYKSVSPSRLNFVSTENDSSFFYKYDVLKQAGNIKLSKKEWKKKVNIVAVKIINSTGMSLKYGQNYKIFSGNNEVPVLPVSGAASAIRQEAPLYLLYLLLTPMKLTVTTGASRSVTPIGFVVGPGLAAFNVLKAANANRKFKNEMEACSITDKEIKPGETLYGLIGIPYNQYQPLKLRLVN
jgi:hypothetical protein